MIVLDIPYKKTKKGIILKIKVVTKSPLKGIAGITGDYIKVKINSPPVKEAANNELIDILSKQLCIKKTDIKIIKGHHSKNKIIEIDGKEKNTFNT